MIGRVLDDRALHILDAAHKGLASISDVDRLESDLGEAQVLRMKLVAAGTALSFARASMEVAYPGHTFSFNDELGTIEFVVSPSINVRSGGEMMKVSIINAATFGIGTIHEGLNPAGDTLEEIFSRCEALRQDCAQHLEMDITEVRISDLLMGKAVIGASTPEQAVAACAKKESQFRKDVEYSG